MRITLIAAACCIATGGIAGTVGQLPLGSDYCAILRAFTQVSDPRCPAPENLGQRRSVNSGDSTDADAGYFIQFALDSAVLDNAYQQHLDQLADVLGSDAMHGYCIRVVGHADTTGAEAYNQGLSVRRARAVQLYLVGVRNLAAARINTLGKGEAEPLPDLPGTDPLNRRVELLAKPADGGSCS